MINYFLSRLPDSVFNHLYQLIKVEKLRRCEYLVENYESSSVYISLYKDYKIEITTEQEKSYLSTWAIYNDKGVELMAEENDFYYSIGEAERDAINWINSQEKGNV